MESGKDIESFVDQLLLYIRDLLLVSICNKKEQNIIQNVSADINLLRTQSSSFSAETLMYMFQIISEAKTKPGDLLQQKIFLEVLFIKLATMEELKPLSTVLDKIEGMKMMFEGNTEEVGNIIVPIHDKDTSVQIKPEIKEKPSNDDVDLSEKAIPNVNFTDIWDKTMNELLSKKKTTWALLKSARALNINDNELVIEVPKNYLIHKERLEKPEEKRIIDNCLEKVTGKKLHVKFLVSKNGYKIADDNKSNRHGVVQEGRKKLEDNIKEEPMVKKTIEFFEGSIVNVKGE